MKIALLAFYLSAVPAALMAQETSSEPARGITPTPPWAW
jgi:hypothetical protein